MNTVMTKFAKNLLLYVVNPRDLPLFQSLIVYLNKNDHSEHLPSVCYQVLDRDLRWVYCILTGTNFPSEYLAQFCPAFDFPVVPLQRLHFDAQSRRPAMRMVIFRSLN